MSVSILCCCVFNSFLPSLTDFCWQLLLNMIIYITPAWGLKIFALVSLLFKRGFWLCCGRLVGKRKPMMQHDFTLVVNSCHHDNYNARICSRMWSVRGYLLRCVWVLLRVYCDGDFVMLFSLLPKWRLDMCFLWHPSGWRDNCDAFLFSPVRLHVIQSALRLIPAPLFSSGVL